MILACRHRTVGPALACLHVVGISVEWHGSVEVVSSSGRLSAMMPSVSDPPPGVMATLSQLCAPGWAIGRGFASSAVAANTDAAQTQSTATPTSPQPGRPSRGPRRPKEPYLLETGHMYEATVTAVRRRLAELDVVLPSPSGGDPSIVKACLPISQLTQGSVDVMSTVLTVGENIKVLAVGPSFVPIQVQGIVRTKFLEPQPGAMLTNKQAVFEGAEKRAEEWGLLTQAQRQAFEDSAKSTQSARPSRGARRPREPYLLETGHLYEATVMAVRQKVADLDVVLPAGGPAVKLCMPISQLTQKSVEDMSTVLTVGEKLKVLAVGRSIGPTQFQGTVGTKFLEPQPGAMLTDKQAVMEGAEKRAELWRAQGLQKKAERQAFQESAKVGDVVQAWFVKQGRTSHLVAVSGKHLYRVHSHALQSLRPLTKGQMIQLVVTENNDGSPQFAASQPAVSQASST